MSRKKESEREQIDRMVDEGLGAGHTGRRTGRIDEEDKERKFLKERAKAKDVDDQGRMLVEMDVDRMVNEGLGGGRVGKRSGRIEESHVPEELQKKHKKK